MVSTTTVPAYPDYCKCNQYCPCCGKPKAFQPYYAPYIVYSHQYPNTINQPVTISQDTLPYYQGT